MMSKRISLFEILYLLIYSFIFRLSKQRSRIEYTAKAKYFKKYISSRGNTCIAVYTSSDQKAYYNYVKYNKIFRCSQCNNLSRMVGARLDVGSDGKETFWLSSAPHICEPNDSTGKEIKEYVTIEASQFVVSQTSTGAKQVILFTSEAKDKCYDYRYVKSDWYYCYQCRVILTSSYISLRLCKRPDGSISICFNE